MPRPSDPAWICESHCLPVPLRWICQFQRRACQSHCLDPLTFRSDRQKKNDRGHLLGQWDLQVFLSELSHAARFATQIGGNEANCWDRQAYSWIELGSKVQNRAFKCRGWSSLDPLGEFCSHLGVLRAPPRRPVSASLGQGPSNLEQSVRHISRFGRKGAPGQNTSIY